MFLFCKKNSTASINLSARSFILICICLYGIYRGLFMPSIWSAMYYLPSWQDGIVRRALIGSLLQFFHVSYSYNDYALATSFITFIFLLIILFYALTSTTLHFVFMSLALLSAYGSFLFQEMGYSDQLIFLILLASIFCLQKEKLWLSATLILVAIYIHELAIFFILPAYLYVIYLNQGWKKAGSLAAFFFLASLPLFIYDKSDPIVVEKFKVRALQVFHGPLRVDSFDVFINGFLDRLTFWRQDHFHQLFLWNLPLYFSIACLAEKAIEICFRLGVMLSPTLLSFFGWDIDRWYFLAFLISMWLLIRTSTTSTLDFKKAKYILASLFLLCFLPLHYFFEEELPRPLRLTNISQFIQEISSGKFFVPPRK